MVAWTTAQQQADRYSLDKYVDEVYAAPNPLKEGSFLVIGRKDKNELFRKDDVSADKLEDIVGKDLAEKYKAKRQTMFTVVSNSK